MTDVWASRPLTAPEAAILHHPDRRTAWAPLLVVEVSGSALSTGALRDGLASLAERHSIVGARLRGGEWVARGGRFEVEPFSQDALATLCRPFDLTRDPPLRAALSADGRRLAVIGHHAALDGRALLGVAAHLLGSAPFGDSAATASATTEAHRSVGPGGGAAGALKRLAFPADRVAPSAIRPATEVFVTAELPPASRARVASLAAAATASAQRWNAARGASWRRVGLTIPVGGPPILGNVSTHRRVDIAADADVIAAVTAALAHAQPEAAETASPAVLRLLAPVVERFSDSLLVSNLGLVTLPGAAAVDFYPQARGRSAVALGAASVRGGARRLTLRARDLAEPDAQALLEATVERLSASA